MKAKFSYEGILQSNKNFHDCVKENKNASLAFSLHIRDSKELIDFPPDKKLRKSTEKSTGIKCARYYSLKLLDSSYGTFYVSENIVVFSYVEIFGSGKNEPEATLKIAITFFENGEITENRFFNMSHKIPMFYFQMPDSNTGLKRFCTKTNSLVARVSKLDKSISDIKSLKTKVYSLFPRR